MAEDEVEQQLRRTLRWMAEHLDEPVAGARTGHLRSVDADKVGLYLDEEPTTPRRPVARPVLVAGAALVLIAVGVPLGLVVAGGPGATPGVPRLPDAAATSKVVSALGATTAAGNWDVSYAYTETFGSAASTTTTTTTTTTECSVMTGSTTGSLEATSQSQGVTQVTPGLFCAGGPTQVLQQQPVTVTGTGIIDVDPKAMVADAEVSDFGHVVLRIDPTDVWEFTGGDSGGLAPQPCDVSCPTGQALQGYASLVESTLGTREGATAMLGIASPTGYLELDQNAITGVAPAGTGTVNGQPVTQYDVSVNPSELADDPTASPAEVATIQAAVATLDTAGLSSTTEVVSVDAQGFIVQSITTYAFSDGGTVVVQGDFSNFGCAGTVSMPGQSGPTEPPKNCVSPDSPSAAAATTTTTTTTTSPPATTTTITLPSSTTTTTTQGLGGSAGS